VLTVLYLVSLLAAETRGLPQRAVFARVLTACEAVTRTDVEAAIGRRVRERQVDEEGPASTCEYSTKGGLISITIQRLQSKPNRAVEIAALKKEVGQGTVREAAEFSDAFYFDIPEAGTQLHLIDGSSSHVMVSILGLGEGPAVSGAASQLARKALARLVGQ
jgi:hypothetical protein